MQKDVAANGVTVDLVPDFKTLREYVVAENQPLLAKVTRLAYENIEEHSAFTVGIPEDEPIVEETEEGTEEETAETESKIVIPTDVDPVESMNYLLSLLLSDLDNKLNTAEIRAYVDLMKVMAGEDF